MQPLGCIPLLWPPTLSRKGKQVQVMGTTTTVFVILSKNVLVTSAQANIRLQQFVLGELRWYLLPLRVT